MHRSTLLSRAPSVIIVVLALAVVRGLPRHRSIIARECGHTIFGFTLISLSGFVGSNACTVTTSLGMVSKCTLLIN